MITSYLNREKNFLLSLIKNWCFTFVILFGVFGFSQDKGFVVPDSLKGESFEELEDKFYKNEKNFNLAEIYAKSILRNAKNINNINNIAEGYHMLSYLNYKNETQLTYIDSVIVVTKNTPNNKYPAYAYLVKGRIYNKRKNFKLALDNYVLSEKYASKSGNLFLLNDIYAKIAFLKTRVGKNKEALGIFKKIYKHNIDNNYSKILLSDKTEI